VRQSCKPLFAFRFVFTTKDPKSTKGSENEAFDPGLPPCDVEIDQQAGLDTSEFHAGQQLRLVNASGNTALRKPDAGNPHVRFDEGEGGWSP